MADIGRILLLPPPAVPGRNAPARVGAGRDEAGASAGSGDEQGIATRVDETADSTSNARNKQFRFRVVDGGRSDSLGNAEVPARTDPNATDQNATAARDALGFQAAGNRGTASGNGKGGVPLGTPTATFLAQLIAQEQLPQGLYDPPVKAADRAYRQAGGEPALTDGGTATAHFRIAV